MFGFLMFGVRTFGVLCWGFNPECLKTDVRRGSFLVVHNSWFGDFFLMFGVWTLGPYICTRHKSRFFHLGLDNSRLLLDENCLIRGENQTNLVYFFSNSRRRIAREIHILCQQLRELLFSVAILVDLDIPIFSVHFFHT